MNPIKFGAFLAPHHPIGENPILQYRRDLDLVEQLDPAWLRRVLVWRTPLNRLGSHPIAGDVSCRGRRTHPSHQPRYRRGVVAVSQSVSRRSAHCAARSHDKRPGNLGHRPRCTGFRCPHVGNRPHVVTRPSRRSDCCYSAAAGGGSGLPTSVTGSTCTTPNSNCFQYGARSHRPLHRWSAHQA